MNKIDETLLKLGLEEQEIKTYLALIDYGELTATKLSEKSGLGRVHTYQVTNKLIKKGLVSYVIKNNVKYFSAADPELLLKDLEEKEENLKKILPQLNARKNTLNEETKVEVYRGLDGINSILKLILNDKKDYVMLGGGEEFSKEEVNVITSIFLKRAEKIGIKGKLLERKTADFVIGRHENYRFLDEEFFASTSSVTWGNKHAIFVWTRPFNVILITNQEIANSHFATFNYLWKSAEKPTTKDKKKRLIRI